jgi:hypothetical protein
MLIAFMLWGSFSFGQFAGPVGNSTSTAVHMDSSTIIGWANECVVERGWMNISDTTIGRTYNGQEIYALGHADETGVISLGDSGIAILTFPHPIFNGAGNDFVIFENSFSDSFLELAHVEVSSDGLNYYRFPSDFVQLGIPQIGAFDQLNDASKINNLAGKYRGGYGTPFDLEELTGIPGLNVNSITHIKIIDAVGSISYPYGTTDQNGNFINDPFPTPFPSCGFDLDAVGVFYFQGVNSIEEKAHSEIKISPNPFMNQINLEVEWEILSSVKLYSLSGMLISELKDKTTYLDYLMAGNYILEIKFRNGDSRYERIIKL